MPETIGDYRILGKLGEGGMGIVWEAEQVEPRRKVALKVIRGGGYVDEETLKMFHREADSLGRLKHQGIGAIYQSGRTDDGQHFISMELVRGNTLNRYLAKRPPPTTRSEIEHRLMVYHQICVAVHYAHQRGVIHRDLKPANLIVTEDVAYLDATLSQRPPRQFDHGPRC
jgi:serine/threonine protein kinase